MGEARVLGHGEALATGQACRQREECNGVVDDRPRSVYELVTRKMLEELQQQVREVRDRVNTLLWLAAGAILVDLLMKLVR